MERLILHSDLNSFYASVECLYAPELRNQPVAVAGDPQARHGIILTKNQVAKAYGVKTGEAIWQAKEKCPRLQVIKPHFDRYLRYSRQVQEIYREYSDRIEPFGIDECWLELSCCPNTEDGGRRIAHVIRRRIKEELGLTVSIGVSYNKIFAKLGSDYRKPDAVTVIGRQQMEEIVWPLAVEELLYVGPATKRKLNRYGIYSIGELAKTNPDFLEQILGKNGRQLWIFANGLDRTPVADLDSVRAMKSIGNSTTTAKDLSCEEEVHAVLLLLSESVATRMREQGVRGTTVTVSIRNRDLCSIERQKTLVNPTCLSSVICQTAMELFRASYRWEQPIRSLGVRVSGFDKSFVQQLNLFYPDRQENQEKVEQVVDDLRRRFGVSTVQRASLLKDRQLSGMDAGLQNQIHPVSFYSWNY